MGLKGKILKFMSDILKDGSYYKLYTQAKSTLACGLPKGFLFSTNRSYSLGECVMTPNRISFVVVKRPCGLLFLKKGSLCLLRVFYRFFLISRSVGKKN